MLEPAQKAIGIRKVRGRSIGNRPACAQCLDCVHGPPLSQGAVASTQNQLLGLREEFDLADTAASKLDVVAGNGNRTMASVRANLALDGVDVFDRRVVETAAPD